MNYGTLLSRAALQFRERIAVKDLGHGVTLTYQELDRRVNRLANALLGLGLAKGDRVAEVHYNSHFNIEVDFALAKAGLVRVPMNARLAVNEMVHLISDSGARAVLLGPEFVEPLEAIRAQLSGVEFWVVHGAQPAGFTEYEGLLGRASDRAPDVEVAATDLLSLRYTGGTTGVPKGTMRTHAAQVAVAINILTDSCPMRRADCLLHVQPLSHGSGGYVAPAVARGATQVILPRFDTERTLQVVTAERISVLKLIPTMIIRLLEATEARQADLSSLRVIPYGASAIAEDRLRQAVELFGPILSQTYGQAEAPSTITYLPPEDHAFGAGGEPSSRLASAGIPYTRVDVRLVDADGRPVPTGEQGEVVARGPMNMLGYWNRPDATAETLKNGWIHTGDVGRFDEHGYLFLVDRMSEMVVTGGFNVYPREVEEVLYQHPAVLEAAVVGVPDPEWGQAVKAVVSVRQGLQVTEAEIIEFCRTRLSGYKKPKSVDFVDELPKSSAGKILRRAVKEKYWVGRNRMNV